MLVAEHTASESQFHGERGRFTRTCKVSGNGFSQLLIDLTCAGRVIRLVIHSARVILWRYRGGRERATAKIYDRSGVKEEVNSFCSSTYLLIASCRPRTSTSLHL